MSPATMVLSFDFELAWGHRLSSRTSDHFPGVDGVHEIIPRILDILVRFEVPATWATVGHLMLQRSTLEGAPEPPRRFSSPPGFDGDWYSGIPAPGQPFAERYYAPACVEAIVECPVYQELACHSFSHVLFSEPGCTQEIVDYEICMSKMAARTWGRELTSVVFPRNQIGHLDRLADHGFTCYRGPFTEWYRWRKRDQAPASGGWRGPALKALQGGLRHLSDGLRVGPQPGYPTLAGSLWEIPHGMFLPGNSGLSPLYGFGTQLARATKGMRGAIEHDGLFSLFTHPHNFLPNSEPVLATFEKIVRRAARFREAGRLDIVTMDQAAARLDAESDVRFGPPPAL